MGTICKPSRGLLEERFVVSGRMELDERCKVELRSLAVAQLMASEVVDTARGAHQDLSQSKQFHFNTMTRRYWGQGGEGETGGSPAGCDESIERALRSADVDDMDYFMRSVFLMAVSPLVQGHDSHGNVAQVYDVVAGRQTMLGSFEYLGMLSVARFCLRKYPDLRFNPGKYLRFKIHWREVDNVGIPRVSLDGYELP